jgi:hypothetical protein
MKHAIATADTPRNICLGTTPFQLKLNLKRQSHGQDRARQAGDARTTALIAWSWPNGHARDHLFRASMRAGSAGRRDGQTIAVMWSRALRRSTYSSRSISCRVRCSSSRSRADRRGTSEPAPLSARRNTTAAINAAHSANGTIVKTGFDKMSMTSLMLLLRVCPARDGGLR